MSRPVFIGVVGHKKSGKTTLVERLTAEFTARKMVIGTIKMTTHDLKFDSPGKDTDRHRVAGSRVTLIKSHNEYAIFTNAGYFADKMLDAVFAPCDFVFIEGDSGSSNPKIYVSDSREIRTDIDGEIIALWGEKKDNFGIRHFSSDQIKQLCDFLTTDFLGRG
jgi:molybdopterin-guanine dinucleotide biosynthesis adapter protein